MRVSSAANRQRRWEDGLTRELARLDAEAENGWSERGIFPPMNRWEHMDLPNETHKRVLLPQRGKEYKEVRRKFLRDWHGAAPPSHSVTVYRLQHPFKRAQHLLLKREMNGRVDTRDRGAYARLLWHGTRSENIDPICATGFNRSYGCHAVWGKGVYFAKNAEYSANPRYAVVRPICFDFLFVCFHISILRVFLTRSYYHILFHVSECWPAGSVGYATHVPVQRVGGGESAWAPRP